MPRSVHNSAVELASPLFRRKRKRSNTGTRSSAGLKSFSIVGRRYSASSSRRFSPFFSDRFERRGLVYVGSSIQHKTALDAVFAEYNFTWDAGNRIIEIDSTDGTAEYTYDKTGQLTGADYDYITDELYTYDDNGNRTNAGYVTGDNNETLSDGTYRYSYDAEGNRTEKFLWTDTNNDGIIDASEKTLVQTYNWDYRNRLESVTNYENGIAKEVIDYLYDYLNLMIERTVTDAATSALQSSEYNLYSNGQIVLEYDTTSSVDVVKSINLWGANIDELVAVEQMAQSVNDNNIILWTYGDHLNSIRDVLIYDSITQTAAVVNHLIYNAFGILVSSTDGAVNPASISPLLNFRYTGKFFDDSTGLQNNINRWYDNTNGKWISVDPIGFRGGDINLYRYVKNQIIQTIDDNGTKSNSYSVHNRLLAYSDIDKLSFKDFWGNAPTSGKTEKIPAISINNGIYAPIRSNISNSDYFIVNLIDMAHESQQDIVKQYKNNITLILLPKQERNKIDVTNKLLDILFPTFALSKMQKCNYVAEAKLSYKGLNSITGMMVKSESYINTNPKNEFRVTNLWKKLLTGDADRKNFSKFQNTQVGKMHDLLLIHEKGHLQIAEIYARIFKKEVASYYAIGYGRTPEEALKKAKNQLINAIKERYIFYDKTREIMQKQYDYKVGMTRVTKYLRFDKIKSRRLYNTNIDKTFKVQNEISKKLEIMLINNNFPLIDNQWIELLP